MSERWTRDQSRDAWWELRSFAGRPFGIALAVVGLWPLLAMIESWSVYRDPAVVVAVYVASQILVWSLWWQGRRGLTGAGTVVAGAVLGALNLLLTFEVAPDYGGGSALWVGSSGVTVPMVLGFSRPLREALAVLGVLAGTNVVAVIRSGAADVRALHDAPLHIGMPVAVAAGGLALVAAMRRSAVATSRSREEAERILQQRRISEALAAERSVRYGPWQRAILPLLDDLAGSRAAPRDPGTGARCRALATALRSEIDSPTRSVLTDLILAQDGVTLSIRDLDTAHRLLETERVALVQLVREVCVSGAAGSLQITVLGGDDHTALAILAADGLPIPADSTMGTLTSDGGARWWLDIDLRYRQGAAPDSGQSGDR